MPSGELACPLLEEGTLCSRKEGGGGFTGQCPSRGCPRSCLEYRGLEFQSTMPLGASKEGILILPGERVAEVLVGRESNTPHFFGSQFHTPQRMKPRPGGLCMVHPCPLPKLCRAPSSWGPAATLALPVLLLSSHHGGSAGQSPSMGRVPWHIPGG